MENHNKISLLANDTTIYDYAKKVSKGNDLYKDIVSDVFIYLYELPIEKFNKINDLKSYVCKMIYFSWNSPTSPLFAKYRKDNDYKLVERTECESTELMNEIEKIECRISKTRYPVEVKLFELYVELGTYRAVADAVGISVRGAYQQIQKVISEIKTKI